MLADACSTPRRALGVRVDPDATVESLSVGERQRVEILKALDHGCRVLILDEPTAVLVPQDVGALFDTIRRLTSGGMGVVFISHKLHEVVTIADRITVLRRGRHVATQPAAGLDPSRIAALMIGAELAREPDVADLVGIAPPGELPVDEARDDAAPPKLAALPATRCSIGGARTRWRPARSTTSRSRLRRARSSASPA